MTDQQDEKALTDIAERLARKFATLDRLTIRRSVDDAYANLRDSPIRDFVPLLVERAASEHLSSNEAHRG